MKIGIVYQSEYPWDVRIDKMVKSLIRNGAEVSVLATNKEGKPLTEEYLGAKVYRLPYKENRILKKLINMPLFFNVYFINAITKMIKDEGLDILMVRDLPLVLAGKIAIKRSKRKVKLAFDMAEDYPATFRVMENRSLLDKLLLRNASLAEFLEKKSVNASDLIMTVVEESKERVEKLNSEKNVIVISNTPDEDFYSNYYNEEILNKYKDTFNIVYEGNFGKKRGLETSIDALKYLKESIPNVRVVLVGGKDDEVNYIKEYAKALGVENYLICTGKVSYNVLAQYVNVANIGMVPHLKCDHTETTIPNKLFDYMCLGKPVIVSDITPLKRIVEGENCGEVFKWDDPKDFANKIISIKEKSEVYGSNSLKAVKAKYNWSYDENILIEELKKLL